MDKDTFFSKKQLIRIKGKYMDLTIPKIVGILNITPDSFFDGGKYTELDRMIDHVDQMLAEGADIIDVGAYSSRPGAENISPEEELQRLTRALSPIRQKYSEIILSVDTFRSDIARKVVIEFQVDIINDISAGMLDMRMADTVAELQVPYIIMHMRGTPSDMQQHTDYTDVIKEAIQFLGRQAGMLKLKGVNDIIIDPGFGFSKTLDQNFQLLSNLDAFKILEYPLLVGISRKSMVYKTLDISPDEALSGTTALHMTALQKGADLLRVHDVKEAKQAVQLYLKTRQEGDKYRKQ
jgi:dihydropteroate synthase